MKTFGGGFIGFAACLRRDRLGANSRPNRPQIDLPCPTWPPWTLLDPPDTLPLSLLSLQMVVRARRCPVPNGCLDYEKNKAHRFWYVHYRVVKSTMCYDNSLRAWLPSPPQTGHSPRDLLWSIIVSFDFGVIRIIQRFYILGFQFAQFIYHT